MSETSRPEWMEDELVKDISPAKLNFLEKLFHESHGKSQKELMSMLLPLLKDAKQQGLTFTSTEMNSAIAAIRKHCTAEESAQMDKILSKSKGGGRN